MIQELKRKFILTTMIAVTLVMAMFLIAVNGINFFTIEKEENSLINMALNRNLRNKPPEESTSKGPMQDIPPHKNLNFQQYFIVRVSEKGQLIDKDTSHIEEIKDSEIKTFLSKVFKSSKKEGIISDYRYQIKKETSSSLIVFLDVSQHKENFIRTLTITLLVGLSTWILLFAFAVFMSKRAIQPIADNMNMQKQFITNASHEIKTPLAIIQSNADVLTMHQGENKWLNNIKKQVKRLNELTKQLITLTKSDEQEIVHNDISSFYVASIIREIQNEYEELLQNKNITVKTTKDDISLTSSEKAFRQIISILFDNAVKYTPSNGYIYFDIEKKKNGISILQKNNIEGKQEENPKKLFERFYRQNKARTQKTGGSGIGLSIAQSVMKSLKGDITVFYSDDKTICFKVYFPKNILEVS